MKTTTVKISGMHCASCSLLIEKSLIWKEWIKKASVSLASNSANIKYDENIIDINDISDTIKKTWYKVVQHIWQEEANKYLYRFFAALLLSIPIWLTMFIEIKKSFMVDLTLLWLAYIVVLIVWWHFHIGFLKKIRILQSNMDTLISIGTLIALSYSTYAFISNHYYHTKIMFHHFLEWAVFIIVFITLGKYLELRSKNKASASLEKLMQLQAKEATILIDNKEQKINIDDIRTFHIVIVRAWDKIPIDGKIVQGNSNIDESMLTWGSIPVTKTIKDTVYSGTIVEDGTLHIKVTKTPKETVLSQIIKAVNEAQSQKPEIQNLADQVAWIFVPVVISIAFIAFLTWYLITKNFDQSLLILVSTIVVACPCALWLATPMAIMIATWTGAQKWILIKTTKILEKSQKINTVVFDKTGTLTEWKPEVIKIETFFDFTEDNLVKIASWLSMHSIHPLSKAIVKYADDNNIKSMEITNFIENKGKWIIWYIWKDMVLIWNKELMKDNEIEINANIEKNCNK